MPCIYCVVWWSMILHQSVQPQNVCYFTIQMMLYVSILWQIKTMICRMSMIDLITFLLLADTDLTRSLCCSLFDLTSSSGHCGHWDMECCKLHSYDSELCWKIRIIIRAVKQNAIKHHLQKNSYYESYDKKRCKLEPYRNPLQVFVKKSVAQVQCVSEEAVINFSFHYNEIYLQLSTLEATAIRRLWKI